MKEKLTSFEEAARLVKNGYLLGLTSPSENAPMAFLRELVRLGRKNLRVATLTGGSLNVDLLIGAGAVAEYETCACSLGGYGQAPNFQRALRSEGFKMKDSTWGVMNSMVQAGSMGVPFVAVRGLMGTDILKNRPDLQVITNPFHPEEKVVVAQPIRPDVAVFHALKADRWGNTLTPGLRDDLMMARAARRVVVTAEEIRDKELTIRDGVDNTFLPAIDVDVVVHVPWGAHPCACGLLYNLDDAHLREYIEAAQEEKKFKNYLERYVGGVKNHQEYLQRVGVMNPLRAEKINV